MAESSLSYVVVLLLQLRRAASRLIMRKCTVLHIKVNQNYWELVNNENSRALPRMNQNVWERGPVLKCCNKSCSADSTISPRAMACRQRYCDPFWEREQASVNVLISSTRALAIMEFTSLAFRVQFPKWNAGHRKAEREGKKKSECQTEKNDLDG